MNKSEWPVIRISNMEETLSYYTQCLNFKVLKKNNINVLSQILIQLYDFFLILQRGKKAPMANKDEPPTLFIPVPDCAEYFNQVSQTEARLVSDNRMIDHDFEGFYVKDNEGNRLLFFRDHHGPYDPSHWNWDWELNGR